MASSRAAQLTDAYKTLTDVEARAEYDSSLGSERRPGMPPPTPTPAGTGSDEEPAPATAEPAPQYEPAGHRFAEERAGKDDIVRRAIMARLREVLRQTVGDCDTSPVRGFDIACLSHAKPSLFRRQVPPSVLVRLVPTVDAAVATAAWADAVKLRLPQRPLIILLLGEAIAPGAELGRAIEEQRRRHPALQDALFPVPISTQDWAAKIPANAPDSVKRLVERLRNYVG